MTSRCRHTINRFALCQIVVVLAGQEPVAIATDDSFDVAVVVISRAHMQLARITYPLLTLKRSPSMSVIAQGLA